MFIGARNCISLSLSKACGFACRLLLGNFQQNRATYQVYRPLGTREEVQQLRILREGALKGRLAPYSGPVSREVPVTVDEEAEESERQLERLRLEAERGELGDGHFDSDEDDHDQRMPPCITI